MARLARIIGAATAAYSVALIVKPAVLAKPAGLLDDDGRVPAGLRPFLIGIGVRDLATGLAMAVAPEGAPLRTAIAARVASDLGDAVALGTLLPDPDARKKAAGVAGGWGLLTLLSSRWAG